MKFLNKPTKKQKKKKRIQPLNFQFFMINNPSIQRPVYFSEQKNVNENTCLKLTNKLSTQTKPTRSRCVEKKDEVRGVAGRVLTKHGFCKDK